jgi:hypothetical protein
LKDTIDHQKDLFGLIGVSSREREYLHFSSDDKLISELGCRYSRKKGGNLNQEGVYSTPSALAENSRAPHLGSLKESEEKSQSNQSEV